MDPLSLSSLGAVGLGYAVKFLFDRASAALDRRAQDRAASTPAPVNSSPEKSPTVTSADAQTAVPGQHKGTHNVARDDAADKDAAEHEVINAMRVLEVYRAKNLAFELGDAVLLDTVRRLHVALERLEGVPVDLNAAARSLIEVDQSAEHVRGVLTGADLGVSTPEISTHVRQRINTVHEGGSVTGFRVDGTR